MWALTFHLTTGLFEEHFLHINGLADISCPLQFGHSILKKCLFYIYIVLITKNPVISLYSLSFMFNSTASETLISWFMSLNYLNVEICLKSFCNEPLFWLFYLSNCTWDFVTEVLFLTDCNDKFPPFFILKFAKT